MISSDQIVYDENDNIVPFTGSLTGNTITVDSGVPGVGGSDNSGGGGSGTNTPPTSGSDGSTP